MVRPKTSLSVGRGCIRDGMPVSTVCVGDATPTYQRRPGWLSMAVIGQEHGPRPGPNPAHRPILKPASASTAEHNRLDRIDPAPTTIEAEIFSPPGRRRRTGRSYRKIFNQTRDQTPNHPSLQPAPQLSAACKAHFWLLYFATEKSNSPASAQRVAKWFSRFKVKS